MSVRIHGQVLVTHHPIYRIQRLNFGLSYHNEIITYEIDMMIFISRLKIVRGTFTNIEHIV